jgi:Family of unknown function (DUF5333)
MTRMFKPLILAALVALTALAAPAAALPPLAEQDYVTGRLMAARVADRIRRTCPDLSARLIYAYGEARGLKRWAAEQGYSDDEIDAYLDDRVEKKRIYALAEEYLTTNGAVDEAGFCALGQAEIAKKSYIGSFLY